MNSSVCISENADFKISGSILERYFGTEEYVVIPDGITEISDEAFEGNSTVKEIHIPATVENINAWLFFECDNLQNITVDNNPYMTKIGDCIYSKDKTILLLYPPYLKDKVFKIPSFVKEIGRTAFYRSNVEKVICNTGLRAIGEGAFYSCVKLKEIEISDTVSEIGAEAFFNCKSLLKIKIPDGITNIRHSTFDACEHLQEVILPDSVKSIGALAFNNCSDLRYFTMPNHIEHIADNALSIVNLLMNSAN